jgi:hypothetical protein
MKTNKLIGSGIALVLIIIVLVGLNLWTDKKSGKAEAFFPDFTPETCAQVVISTDDTYIRLFKQNGTWMVSDAAPEAAAAAPALDETADTESVPSAVPQRDLFPYRADSAAVQKALRTLGEIEKEMLISRNPEKREKFEVDSGNGLTVEVFDQNRESLGSIVIGKSGPDFGSNYIRPLGSNNVYSVAGNVRGTLKTKPKQWCDETVIAFDKDRAEKIVISKAAKKITLVTRDTIIDSVPTTQWYIDGAKRTKADQSKVQNLINAISNLTCDDWETGSLSLEEMGFSPPQLGVRVSLSTGKTKELLLGAQKDKRSKYFAKLPDEETIFLIAKNDVNKMDKNVEDFMPKNRD